MNTLGGAGSRDGRRATTDERSGHDQGADVRDTDQDLRHHAELHDLDAQVEVFLKEQGATEVFSMSDSTTVGESGETIGLIRAVTYSVPD